MKVNNFPLLKILLPFVSGILTAYFCHFPFRTCRIWFGTAAFFWLISCLLTHVKTYKWQWCKTLILTSSFFFAGAAALNFRFSSHLNPEQYRLMSENRDWLCRLEDFPIGKTKTVKLVVRVLQTGTGQAIGANTVLYVQRSPDAEALNYGDLLLIHTRWDEIAPPRNPDAFDNQRYLNRKGIYYSGYVSNGFWTLAGNQRPNPLKTLAHQMQGNMAETLARAGLSGKEYDIVKAILLGDDDTMEPELKASYAAAGVSHILCVSGMHVGVIFLILDFLLKPFNLFKGTRRLKSLILILTIWLYGHITGLSPSVTRAATMFTFVTIGQNIQRNTNVFHSLLASLWILLTLNPMLLFELGFQLSYLAVTGIVLFQPLLSSACRCKTRVGIYFRDLASVSVAAQLATFPMSAHFFGRFPNYFLLSNMSVITLSFVVMITGVALLCLSPVPGLGTWTAWLLTREVRLMNNIISFIERLPGSVTENIDFSVFHVLLLYIIIILVYVAIRYRRKRVAWAAYLVFALFSGTFLLRKVVLLRQEDVTVYSVPKTCAISFCHRQQCVFFSDSITGAGDGAFRYAAAHHVLRQHAACAFVPADTARYDRDFLCKRGPMVRFNRQTYYLLKKKEKVYPTSKPLLVDVLVLQYNPTQLPDDVAEALSFQNVIADETNTGFYIERWKKWCKEHGIPFTSCASFFRIFAPS